MFSPTERLARDDTSRSNEKHAKRDEFQHATKPEDGNDQDVDAEDDDTNNTQGGSNPKTNVKGNSKDKSEANTEQNAAFTCICDDCEGITAFQDDAHIQRLKIAREAKKAVNKSQKAAKAASEETEAAEEETGDAEEEDTEADEEDTEAEETDEDNTSTTGRKASKNDKKQDETSKGQIDDESQVIKPSEWTHKIGEHNAKQYYITKDNKKQNKKQYVHWKAVGHLFQGKEDNKYYMRCHLDDGWGRRCNKNIHINGNNILTHLDREHGEKGMNLYRQMPLFHCKGCDCWFFDGENFSYHRRHLHQDQNPSKTPTHTRMQFFEAMPYNPDKFFEARKPEEPNAPKKSKKDSGTKSDNAPDNKPNDKADSKIEGKRGGKPGKKQRVD
ncbi:hypothetical protein F5Y16DRAFT_405544 [Xylariaceae sp. FL0255]|nr:hypothetical protein F5Y16DRAFT_405544 [Xylariaceae sp. FL0255]